MPDYYTELRTFVGEKTSVPGTGYAGFLVGQRYRLQFCPLGDGTVHIQAIALFGTHAITVSEGLFERWWLP